MSATNRGAERLPDDTYETPTWAAAAMMPWLKRWIPKPNLILEPGAGTGRLVKVLHDAYPDAYIHAIEKRNLSKILVQAGAAEVNVGNFLTSLSFPDDRYDLIFGNPPYSLAMAFIEKAMRHTPYVCFLLRLNFLGSQRRSIWLRRHTPAVFVLPKRPSFTSGGTDACEYGWFLWGAKIQPRIRILKVRQPHVIL